MLVVLAGLYPHCEFESRPAPGEGEGGPSQDLNPHTQVQGSGSEAFSCQGWAHPCGGTRRAHLRPLLLKNLIGKKSK